MYFHDGRKTMKAKLSVTIASRLTDDKLTHM